MMSGAHAGRLGGEERAGAPEAGRDLVEDQHQPVLVGDLAHHAQAVGVVDVHPARALEQRLHDDPGQLVCVRRGERAELRPPSRDVAPGRGWLVGEDLLRQHLAEHRVHPAHRVADAHAAEGVAVVAAAHGEHPGPLGWPRPRWCCSAIFSATSTLTEPGVGEEDVLEPVRGQRDEPLGEADRGRVGEAAEHHVRHVAELPAHARRRAPGTAYPWIAAHHEDIPSTSSVPSARAAGGRRTPTRPARTGVGSVIDV